MAIKIKIGINTEAVINDGIWNVEDDILLPLLNTFKLPSGYIYWPDYTLAEMACKALGGKIIEATEPPEYIEGRVY